MSTKTKNIELEKPDIEDFYDIPVQNGNMDKIDAEIGKLEAPEYELGIALEEPVSGESIFKAFGKIKKAVSALISHIRTLATASAAGHMSTADKIKLDGVATGATKSPISGSTAVTTTGEYALDAVQANKSVVGTIAAQIESVKNELKVLQYPIGYIFTWEPVAGSPDLSTPQKVHDYYGIGTWELIKDRMLVGAGGSYGISSIGGEVAHALTVAESPAHNHTYSGNTGNNSVDHVHGGNTGTISADHTHAGYTSVNGNHNHPVYAQQISYKGTATGWFSCNPAQASSSWISGDNGNHNHTVQTYGISANHVHGFTTGGQNTGHVHSYSGATTASGSGGAHNNMPPYLAVYMWKRTA